MNQREESYRRILLVFGICLVILIGLVIQVFRIQIINYGKLSKSANGQRRAVLLNNQLRGVFLDRNGRELRNINNDWYLLIQRTMLDDRDKVKIAAIVGNRFMIEFDKRPEKPLFIYSKPLTDLQINSLEQSNIKGLKIIANCNRNDSSNPLAWHLLGFVNRGQGFSGLEYLYNSILYQPNTNAAVFAINDGWHRYIPGLGLRTSSTRNKAAILLTLDAQIQRIAENVMDQTHMQGAVVILDTRTGDILAMASRPMVNLNNLVESTTDNGYPFLNRAISAYHPGSIFKLVILAAGLDSGQINFTDQFYDPGYFEANAKKWYCTSSGGTGHGLLTVTGALAYSCNPIFIQIMRKLEPKLILEYADKFGLGQPCNIGLHDESWGEVPSELDLTIGEQVNIALGEGNIYGTPLQIASLVQTIVNNGIRKRPRLVAGYINQSGNLKKLPLSPGIQVINTQTAQQIQQMMTAVVAFGTGTEAQIPDIRSAGKTGTAQSGDEKDSPEHAWFVGYTPLDNPRYVTAVFCEQGISGGKTAAPIFKEIMERVLKVKCQMSKVNN